MRQGFSFLPQDTITPAINRAGAMMIADNQQKIARAENTRSQFDKLLDISYEGMTAKQQKEVMDDWDKFKSDAVRVFSKASADGTPINANDWADVMRQHNEVVRKAEYAKQLKGNYFQAVQQAAKLKNEGKLDPATDKALDEWLNGNTPIYDTPLPTSLIETQYSNKEVDALEKAYLFNDTTLLKKYDQKLPNGDIKQLSYYDPENIASVARDAYNTDPQFAKFVDRNYKTLDNYVAQKKNIYDKQYQGLKNAPSSMSWNFGSGSGQPGNIPKNVDQETGNEYWATNQLPGNLRKWSGKVTYGGKQYPVSDQDVTRIERNPSDGSMYYKVNVTIPNPKYNRYDPSSPKNITFEYTTPDDGALQAIAKKNKYWFEGMDSNDGGKDQSGTGKRKAKNTEGI